MKNTNQPKIIVALPAYNEGHYIDVLVAKAQKYADEVIVINDGSEDRTAVIARQAGATVVSHKNNMGYGMAIQTILAEARKRAFDVLVLLDADTQHNPDEIPCLIEPILEGYDLVIGTRSRKDIPPYRYVGQKVLSLFTNILSGKKIEDTQSGFRAFSKKAVAELQPREKGMAISSEVVAEAIKRNLKIAEVLVSVRYTKDGSTMNPVVQGFYTLYRIIIMIAKRNLQR